MTTPTIAKVSDIRQALKTISTSNRKSIVEQSKHLFLESKEKSEFLEDICCDYFCTEILDACTIEELKQHDASSLKFLTPERIFYLRNELRDWYVEKLDEKDLLKLVTIDTSSSHDINKSLAVMNLFIKRHKGGSLSSGSLQHIITQAKREMRYPDGSTKTVSQILYNHWMDERGNFYKWESCKELSDCYDYFEKIKV